MSDIGTSNGSNSVRNSENSDIRSKTNSSANGKNKKSAKNKAKEENIVWGAEHEKILVEWADKAMCYQWLHSKSNHKYSYINLWFTIPVIIISTVTGTLNFAQEKFPADYRGWVSTGIGSLNIMAGIITTIHQYFKYVELNEAHRVASVGWSKFYRNIRVELARRPVERMNVGKMLKVNKEEYDRLMETCPDIPSDIIWSFKHEFMGEESKECCTSCKTCCDKLCCVKRQEDTAEYKKRMKAIRESRERIYKPEVCDVLISTQDQKYELVEGLDYITTEGMIEMIRQEKDANPQYEFEINKIEKFKRKFLAVKGREPTEQEVIDNLEDDVEPNIIKKILHGEINGEGQADMDNIMTKLRERNAFQNMTRKAKNVSPMNADLDLEMGLEKEEDANNVKNESKKEKKNKVNNNINSKKKQQDDEINEIIQSSLMFSNKKEKSKSNSSK